MPSETKQSEKEFAVVVLSEDGTIVDAHDACKDSFGWSRENLAGQDISTLLPAHRGLLLSGILQSSDLESQLGDEPTFSMRIVAQRVDHSSFPARLVVRRFGDTDCWAASFYHTAPLALPDPHAPHAPGASEDFASTMQCIPLEETPESSNEPPNDFDDKASALPEPPSPPSAELSEAGNDSSLVEICSHAPHLIDTTPASQTSPHPASQPAAQAAPKPFAAQNKSTRPPVAPTTTAEPPDETPLLEQRVASLTSQLSSLHTELRQHLEVQARTEKKLSTFEDQLSETKKSLACATADLALHKTAGASGELESARALNQALEKQLALHKSAHEALQRANSEAERQLADINSELNQLRAALAQETAIRHELERKLTALDQDRSVHDRETKLEICRLEAALKAKELELKQLELARFETANRQPISPL